MPNFCPSCGTKLNGAAFCPECGVGFSQSIPKPTAKRGLGFRRILLLFIPCGVGLIILVGMLSSSDDSSHTTNTSGTSPTTGGDQTAPKKAVVAAPTAADLKSADYLDQHYDIQATSACDVRADEVAQQCYMLKRAEAILERNSILTLAQLRHLAFSR